MILMENSKTKDTTLAGVYKSVHKDGSEFYRSSFTYKNKHISLGSYPTELQAGRAYIEASRLIKDKKKGISDYKDKSALSFEKWVVIINFRDNDIYFSTPIYIRSKYFSYYIDKHTELKFSVDDLFYYSSHKIMKRGRHLFVADYGMQVSIAGRYGIKPHAVCGKDYIHKNGDNLDYCYENIEVMNAYHGVSYSSRYGKPGYKAKIHVNGDYVIGYYQTAVHAAIAYNKAVDILKERGLKKEFRINYIEEISPSAYADIYSRIKISPKILNYN